MAVTTQIADDILRLYSYAKSTRSPHENDWRMAAAYVLPAHYAAWQSEGPVATVNPTAATRRIQYDTTGTRSLPKYVSILERIATPIGQRWHGLTASDPELRKKIRVRRYFDELQDRLFRYRYNPRATFRTATNEMYMSMGVYGNGPIYIGQRRVNPLSPQPGFKYTACHMRDVFFMVDDDGEVAVVFRRFYLNVRQFQRKFPDETLPVVMMTASGNMADSEGKFFEFVHYVAARDQSTYDPEALDARRHPIVGAYLCVDGKVFVGEEHGYRSLPYKIPRTQTVAGDPYGYSPAIQALAALGGASQMKKTSLKQGNKAVDPALMAFDDGVLNGEVDQRPGAVNYGGVNKDGRALIAALPTGNFQVGEVMLQDERKDIEDSFFVTLFQILTETPEMTATEVVERVAEKASLLSPTMGRLQSEFLGPSIEREIEMMDEIGVLPIMPPELIEARGEYEVVYTSPLAKGMYAEEISGFMRSVEMALNIAQATQNAKPLHTFNFDVAIPEIADRLSVPARWMATPEEIAAAEEADAKAMETAQMLKAAPGIASVAKTAADMGKPASRR